MSDKQAQKDEKDILSTITDRDLRASCDNLLNTLKQSAPSETSFESFETEISSHVPEPQQIIMSFIPHDLAKVSIFFPMSNRELKEENRYIHRIEQKTAWGIVVVEGIKLSISEEDIFLALMTIAKDKASITDKTYTLQTNFKDIIALLYGRSGYTKQSYERIDKALAHMQLVRFEINTKKSRQSFGGIISYYNYDPKTHAVHIDFNIKFFEFFFKSMLTYINFTMRRKLKRDGSKALFRFICAHKKPSRMHILTLLKAINYNIDQPMFRLRSRLKALISELKSNGVLGNKTKIYKDDTVYLDTIKPKKQLPD